MKTRMENVTVLHVGCPYCKAGHAHVSVVHRNGADQLEGVKDPHKCDSCGCMMGIKIQMSVLGVPLPGQPLPTQGEVLRRILSEAR